VTGLGTIGNGYFRTGGGKAPRRLLLDRSRVWEGLRWLREQSDLRPERGGDDFTGCGKKSRRWPQRL